METYPRYDDLAVEAFRLRRLFDHLPALTAYWDKDCRNVLANAAYVEWFGQAPEEIRGRHISELLGAEVYAKNLPYIEGALRGEEQLFYRTLVDPRGRVRHSQASYVPDVSDGEVQGFFVLVTDITAQVEAERILDEAQELSRTGSWTYYPHTGEMTWSAELFRLIGLQPGEVEPSPDVYMSRVHPEDVPKLREIQARAGTLGAEYEMYYRIVLPDGSLRHVHSRGRPELGADGATIRLTGTVQDETEIHRANSSLEEANTLLSDMLGMLGHDVRQPITIITGMLEFALEHWDGLKKEMLQEQVRRSLGAARRMNSLLDDVLTMVNLDSGQLVTRPTAARLGELVPEICDAAAPGGEVAVEIRLDSTVMVDTFHLRQVLTNLLTNALRYGRPPVTVTATHDSVNAQIRVSDHGDGVPDDFVPSLFERFSRAKSGVAASKQGSGFGLYIANRLAQANGGNLTYSPAQPHGATFTLSVPLASPSTPPGSAHAR